MPPTNNNNNKAITTLSTNSSRGKRLDATAQFITVQSVILKIQHVLEQIPEDVDNNHYGKVKKKSKDCAAALEVAHAVLGSSNQSCKPRRIISISRCYEFIESIQQKKG